MHGRKEGPSPVRDLLGHGRPSGPFVQIYSHWCAERRGKAEPNATDTDTGAVAVAVVVRQSESPERTTRDGAHCVDHNRAETRDLLGRPRQGGPLQCLGWVQLAFCLWHEGREEMSERLSNCLDDFDEDRRIDTLYRV